MTANTPPSLTGLRVADIASIEAEADLKQAQATSRTEPLESAKLQAEAHGLRLLAAHMRDPTASGLSEFLPGRGGEVSPLPAPKMDLGMKDAAETVHSPPDLLAAEASLSRLKLAREAGVLTEAVDAAESIEAENAVEQMIVHGMAAAHRMSMRMFGVSDTMLRLHEGQVLSPEGRTAHAEAIRCALVGARLLDSVTRAASAIDRLRNGGCQQMIVEHLTVADGGQAVVAGNVETGNGPARWGKGRRGRRPG